MVSYMNDDGIDIDLLDQNYITWEEFSNYLISKASTGG